MRVHIEPNWLTNNIDAWFVQDTYRGMQLATLGAEGVWTLSGINPGEHRGDPSLTLPRDWFEALIAAGSNILPPDRAMGNHLADAITVRDRLLALIEQTA